MTDALMRSCETAELSVSLLRCRRCGYIFVSTIQPGAKWVPKCRVCNKRLIANSMTIEQSYNDPIPPGKWGFRIEKTDNWLHLVALYRSVDGYLYKPFPLTLNDSISAGIGRNTELEDMFKNLKSGYYCPVSYTNEKV